MFWRLLAVVCMTSSIAEASSELRLMTEEYPPYNYTEGDQVAGLGAEQVFELMDRAGVSYKVEVTRWSRAIGSARRHPATCVFSTFRTPQREQDFVWIGPLSEDRSLLISREQSGIKLEKLDDAKRYSIGTQTGEFTVGILESAGFGGIEQAPSMAVALRKLLVGRNDLMAVPELYYKRLLEQGVPVVSVLSLPVLEVALACNPGTDPVQLDTLRSEMESMIADGTQAAILARHK